jgi:hypothetical protein
MGGGGMAPVGNPLAPSLNNASRNEELKDRDYV